MVEMFGLVKFNFYYFPGSIMTQAEFLFRLIVVDLNFIQNCREKDITISPRSIFWAI